MAEAHRQVSPARVFARPTADQIWLGPAQRAALSQFSRNARARLLIGPPSSGKSTLLTHLAARWAAERVVLSCRGPKEDATAVLAALLLSADLAPWELSEVEQRNLFTVFVQQRRSQNRRVVVVLDDAHTFEPAAWDEISRMLAFSIDRKPALDVLLAGNATLMDRVDSAALGVAEKDVCVHRLDPPSEPDLMAYVEWRLERFGMTDLVSPVAAQMIAKLSGERYGAVDVLCQMSLLLLRQLSLERVDARVARQAAALLASRHESKLEAALAAEPEAEPPRSPLPQGHLLISRGGKLISRVPLGQRTLVGRSEHNDACLPSPYLSRHHAVIVGTPEGYYVVDLNSMNGIALNGRRIDRAVLCDQDVLAVGPFRIKVQIPEWLATGDPLPGTRSLADTAVMPPDEPSNPNRVRRVK
jgi:type II secretory pathway predicted ATPase ExeA